MNTETELTAARQCPVCRVDLETADRHGMQIDYCPRCRGVWFEREQLNEVLGRCRSSAEMAPASGAWHRSARISLRE